MSTALPRIAFLGIGLMGAPMTRNLLDAGFPMTLGNRTASKCEPFLEEAAIAETPAEAVADADVVITMLENGQVVEDVLVHQGAIGALKAGALVVDMSSVQPSLARELAGLVGERGAGFVDAPVSGCRRRAPQPGPNPRNPVQLAEFPPGRQRLPGPVRRLWRAGPGSLVPGCRKGNPGGPYPSTGYSPAGRSEEHTSELQSRPHLVCRLL